MHGSYLPRLLEKEVEASLAAFPAVAILGPRQAGKSTLASQILHRFDPAIHLDLE